MEEGSDELERKIEKLNAQLARQTARAEKVHCPRAGGVGVVGFGVGVLWIRFFRFRPLLETPGAGDLILSPMCKALFHATPPCF